MTIEVHGHRGARAKRPENTLPAFEYALDVGVDVLELDLAITKDDVVVVSHDLYVNTTLAAFRDGKDVPEKYMIREHTLEELRAIDFGSKRNPRFQEQTLVPGTSIATLDDVFELVKSRNDETAKKVKFNIETKIKPAHPEWTPSPERYAELVVERFQKHGMLERTFLQSFDRRTLIAAKSIAPTLKTVQLTSDNLIDFVAAALSVEAYAISPDKDWMTKEDVERLHQADVAVIPWTANNEGDWQRLIEMKVDAIITDDPEGLIAYLKSLGLR